MAHEALGARPPRHGSSIKGTLSKPKKAAQKNGNTLKQKLIKGWYLLTFAAIILVPAGVCQMFFPVVSYDTWEDMSEDVYAQLLRFDKPNTETRSKIVLLEVDQRSLDAYGWPIDRTYYVQMLRRLKESGHPWLLSLLQFQSLTRGKGWLKDTTGVDPKDWALVQAISGYERYIGSGLRFDASSELTSEAEEHLMPRVVLTPTGAPLEELPRLPLDMAESEIFVKGQKAFGYGAHFGTEPTIYCMQMFLTDRAYTGFFLLPSSLVWAASYALQARIQTSVGPSWPRPAEGLPYAPKSRLQIAYKHCLTSPSIITSKYLKDRHIERLSLVDLISARTAPNLKGQLVVLGRHDMRRFRGPGVTAREEEAIVSESDLVARFLDGMLEGKSIRREPMARHPLTPWLPLALALGLAFTSLALSPLGAGLLALFLLLGLMVSSFAYLREGIYVIWTPAMVSVGVTALGLFALSAYVAHYGVRRQVQFANKLRQRLDTCSNHDDLEAFAAKCLAEEFAYATLGFQDFDRELYEAAKDPQAAARLLDQRKTASLASESAGQFSASVNTVQTRLRQMGGLTRMPLRTRGMELTIKLTSELGFLGTAHIRLTYELHEEKFVPAMIDILRKELALSWHRIKLLVDQKLLDYKFLMEQTRGDIMERFLTQVLVSKFSDNKTMLENLRAVLTPRATKAALLQADIRGYSKISAKLEPLEMVKLLQRYYSHVVDAAQIYAQVKLIGDCIFLFIEDAAGDAKTSPADLALDIAATLIKGTLEQNAVREAQGEEGLNFGIAIHYGSVVVGNLSSDSCIDYTVIGPNVNLVARLEELTKIPSINAAIGNNGIVLTEEAAAALIKHRATRLVRLDLAAMNASVRSFTEVKRLLGLSAINALNMGEGESRPVNLRQAG